RGAHGRRTRRVRVRQALLRVGPRTAPVGGSRRGYSGQQRASPALSGAPLTDLRWPGFCHVSRDGETRTPDPLLPNLKSACSEGIFWCCTVLFCVAQCP